MTVAGAAARDQQRLARAGDQPRAGAGPAAARPESRSCSRSSRRACSTRRRTASRSNRPFDNGGMDNFQISGGRGFTNEFLLDGVPNTGTETNQPNNLSFVPSPDATAEFKVQTSIYDAQYGRTGGGVVNVVLKSGTNQFHGPFYEYYRDESAEREHVRRQPRRPARRRASTGTSRGSTVDGPVRIPGLYNGTDKTFFMYNWEQIRSEVPFPQVYTVPSALERAGDFSQTRTADGRPITIYDPLTTRQVNGQFVRDPFPGQRHPGQPHRSGRARAPAAGAAAERVRASSTTCWCRRTRAPTSTTSTSQIDQVLNANHRFFVALRPQQAHRDQRLRRIPARGLALVPARAHERRAQRRSDVGAQPVARAQLARRLHPPRLLHRARTATASIRRTLGFPSSSSRRSPRNTFPQIQYEGYSDLRQHVRRQHRQHLHRERHVVVVGDPEQDARATTRSSSAASIRAMINDQQNPTSLVRPLQLQPRLHPAQRPLRADVDVGQRPSRRCCSAIPRRTRTRAAVPINPQLNYRSNYYGIFVQDDWRMTDKLTVNLGLRWDYESPDRRSREPAEHRLRRRRGQPVPGARHAAARRPAVRERRDPPAVQARSEQLPASRSARRISSTT